MSEWKWLGHAMHLCVSHKCRFHMATIVGNGRWCVSTVGDYYEDGKRTTIGAERYLETYVFEVGGGELECGCPGLASLSEIDSEGYQTAAEAQAGHMAMCRKWDARKG